MFQSEGEEENEEISNPELHSDAGNTVLVSGDLSVKEFEFGVTEKKLLLAWIDPKTGESGPLRLDVTVHSISNFRFPIMYLYLRQIGCRDGGVPQRSISHCEFCNSAGERRVSFIA